MDEYNIIRLIKKEYKSRGRDLYLSRIWFGPQAHMKTDEELAQMIIESIDKATPLDFHDSYKEILERKSQDVSKVSNGLIPKMKKEKVNMASTVKRDQRIVSGLRSGRTFRDVADAEGVHHRTAQRVAERHNVFSVRSDVSVPEDFNKKGAKVWYAIRGMSD